MAGEAKTTQTTDSTAPRSVPFRRLIPTFLILLLIGLVFSALRPVSEVGQLSGKQTELWHTLGQIPEVGSTAAPGRNSAGSATSAPTVEEFEDLQGNLAHGERAPDFTAQLLGSDSFSLSDQKGRFTLIYGTFAVGCGDCVTTLKELSGATEKTEGSTPITMLVLNLYPDDPPGHWLEYAERYGESRFLWGVADSFAFVKDYEVHTLGTTFLIDPSGRVVYRRGRGLTAEEFTQLLGVIKVRSEQARRERSG